MARLVSGSFDGAGLRRPRLSLPLRLSVLTLSTLTPGQIASTASRISGFDADGCDDERVDVRVEQAVGLLAHDRADDDVSWDPSLRVLRRGGGRHARSAASRLVKTTKSLTSTS